jgi:hypothetical protein
MPLSLGLIGVLINNMLSENLRFQVSGVSQAAIVEVFSLIIWAVLLSAAPQTPFMKIHLIHGYLLG